MTSAIDRLVHQVKARKGVDLQYMKLEILLDYERRQGKREGAKETQEAAAIAHVRSLRGFSIPEDKISEDLIANFHVDPDQVAEILERASRPEEDLVAT